MTALQAHGILIGTCVDPALAGHHALRLGTQFITRQGLVAAHMPEVARLLTQVLEVASCGRLQTRAHAGTETGASLKQIQALLAGSSA
jgi:glycine hydroxymethyltransferase